MGNNKEIRQRMETYRNVLLAVVWIGAVAGMLGGIIMIVYETGGGWYSYSSNPLRPYGIALLIASIFGGIIGHFLVNVGLAIPFILLNNGDILEALKGKAGSTNVSPEEEGIVEESKLEKLTSCYITSRQTNLKYGSDSITGTIKILDAGTKIKFISVSNAEWYCVETMEGVRGFCLSSDLEEV